jgi:hypothetical protein
LGSCEGMSGAGGCIPGPVREKEVHLDLFVFYLCALGKLLNLFVFH